MSMNDQGHAPDAEYPFHYTTERILLKVVPYEPLRELTRQQLGHGRHGLGHAPGRRQTGEPRVQLC